MSEGLISQPETPPLLGSFATAKCSQQTVQPRSTPAGGFRCRPVTELRFPERETVVVNDP